MGYGDEILVTGLIKKARKLNPNAQFIIDNKQPWDHEQQTIFQNNPYLISDISQRDLNKELIYINDFKGNRGYVDHIEKRPWLGKCIKDKDYRLHYNTNYTASAGEIFFTALEKQFLLQKKSYTDYILLHPYSKQTYTKKNKNWSYTKWRVLVERLQHSGHKLVCFVYKSESAKKWGGRPQDVIPGCEIINITNFREALLVLSSVKLVITTEGAIHHGAAAFNTKAIVLFGGRSSPEIVGYDMHTNLYVPHDPITDIYSPCGMIKNCEHCERCMKMITVDMVLNAINK